MAAGCARQSIAHTGGLMAVSWARFPSPAMIMIAGGIRKVIVGA